jgi:hypothetical protein
MIHVHLVGGGFRRFEHVRDTAGGWLVCRNEDYEVEAMFPGESISQVIFQ